MFGNFLYFIIVLLIYATYPASDKTSFSGIETLVLFLGLIAVFILLNRILFSRLSRLISERPYSRFDHVLDSLITRQSVMAVVLFAIDIYGLKLTAFVSGIRLFLLIPTIQAVFFLGLFIFYLSIVWFYAYGAQQRIYKSDISRQSYILSHISFSIPVLLPWITLSSVVDVIHLLPFEPLKQFLTTTEGQISYFLIFLLGIAIIGPAMIQRFWRCEPIEPGFYRNRIEALCRRAGLDYANILYWPIFGGQMITAGVMGLIKKFRYILVTKGLMYYLEPEEVDAVVAHEIGHVKRKHLLFYLFFFIGYMLLSYTTFDLMIYGIIYAEPLYRLIRFSGMEQTDLFSILFSSVTIVIFFIYFRFVFGYFMRNFERQADTYVYTLFDSAAPLISTLRKIALTSGQSPDKPNWHHFSIQQRIDFLNKCEEDRSWVKGHDRRIKKSIGIYLAAILIIGGLGYGINFGDTGEKLNAHFFEKILERAIERTPDNPNLYSMLGDLYYSRKAYEKTIEAYSHSLMIFPRNPQVLNNLAWLYATCEDRRFRDPEKAVRLAEVAVHLSPEPHILDTLSESYYVNGDIDRAISTAERALNLAKKDRSYFEKQLEKFREAKKKGADRLSSGVTI